LVYFNDEKSKDILYQIKQKQMNAIKPFKNKKVLTHWDEAEELWYFSAVGSAGSLTGWEA